MKKSEWSDKQLEELLRQMPKIHDHRNPRDIYQNLSIKKRKRSAWIIPGIATAAALLLFFLLVPTMFDRTEYSLDRAVQEKVSKEEQKSLSQEDSSTLKEDSTKNETGISGTEQKMLMTSSDKTALYDDELGNGTVLTYWIPDSQAQILVPVSTVVQLDQNKNWLTAFIETMGLLKEEEWGLSDYYPLNATLTLDTTNNTVMVDVPINHKYGEGSASETKFIDSLKKNISSNSQVNKIMLTTNGQPGIEFGNFGEIKEIQVESEGKHAYFFYTPDGMETTYLVPTTDSYQNINAAFEAMKTEPLEMGLTASVVPSFSFKDIEIKENKLIITIDENAVMENNLENVYSLEAILLTAKGFGIDTVRLLNAPINSLGPFDLTKDIKVPLAPNYRPIQ
ncbi:GerMN domain-containing protein [Neobacillus niacini]|uniref:GerMN domain-containing protein n=1 Tax=Neobacillus niacini TaxID=86668 RepID=UPI0007AB550E|nr:GerMN domain-containing protein [Neobacillus niacini]MEC1521534.1 GerMN domain-containing protein [Neobacillus niacini]